MNLPISLQMSYQSYLIYIFINHNTHHIFINVAKKQLQVKYGLSILYKDLVLHLHELKIGVFFLPHKKETAGSVFQPGPMERGVWIRNQSYGGISFPLARNGLYSVSPGLR